MIPSEITSSIELHKTPILAQLLYIDLYSAYLLMDATFWSLGWMGGIETVIAIILVTQFF